MNAHHDETHFIHNFLHKLPPGHLQTYKHRCAIGKACFIRRFILTGNNIFRWIANFYFICTTFFSTDLSTLILFLSVQHTFISPVESARQKNQSIYQLWRFALREALIKASPTNLDLQVIIKLGKQMFQKIFQLHCDFYPVSKTSNF